MASYTMEGDCRVYGDKDRIHKMGWLRKEDVIDICDEYKNWRKFGPVLGCTEVFQPGVPPNELYTELFFNTLDVIVDELQPPVTPIHDDDAALGRSIRVILTELKFLFNYFQGL